MTTVLQYLVIAAVIGLLLFGIALVLFGRGERLSALPARTSPARLPEQGIQGTDVRRVRFALAVRGYRMSDVDWTLDRLADELDRTRQQLALVTGGDPTAAAEAAPAGALLDEESPGEETPARTPFTVRAAEAYDPVRADPNPHPTDTAPRADGLAEFAPGSTPSHDGPDPAAGSPPPRPVARPGSEV